MMNRCSQFPPMALAALCSEPNFQWQNHGPAPYDPVELHCGCYKNSAAVHRILTTCSCVTRTTEHSQKVTLKADAETHKKNRPFMIPGSTSITWLSFLATATSFFSRFILFDTSAQFFAVKLNGNSQRYLYVITEPF